MTEGVLYGDKKAVISVAGYGTIMFPMTKALYKEYQKGLYEHFFFDDVDNLCLDDLSNHQNDYLKIIKKIAKKIRILKRDMSDFGDNTKLKV